MSKKWLLLTVFIVGVISADAQFRKVPAVVTDSFQAKFESADDISWKDRITSFQAAFTLKDKEMKANFSPKGEWLKTETVWDYERVPKNVKDGFEKSKYADFTIVEAAKVDEREKQPEYKLVVKKNDFAKKTLLFAKNGRLISDIISF